MSEQANSSIGKRVQSTEDLVKKFIANKSSYEVYPNKFEEDVNDFLNLSTLKFKEVYDKLEYEAKNLAEKFSKALKNSIYSIINVVRKSFYDGTLKKICVVKWCKSRKFIPTAYE